MVAGPAKEPVTRPEKEPTEAVPLSVLHVPPPAPVSIMDAPTHTCEGPPVAAGSALTVTGLAREQPVGKV
jgi:uncharacterized caspase-like protein